MRATSLCYYMEEGAVVEELLQGLAIWSHSAHYTC